MKKIMLLIAVVELCLGTVAMMHSGGARAQNQSAGAVSEITNAAYRDGLCMGKLAAQRGHKPGIPSGRWARQAERASFTAGFQQGYHDTLVIRRPEVSTK